MDFFSMQREAALKKNAPLADRMRPRSLEDLVGQEEVIGPGKPLYRLIQADRVPSMIFFGPPGSGKTSLAHVVAETTHQRFLKLSAVSSGVKEIRQTIQEAEEALGMEGLRTILFIDEIHRFNKGQQDALLPYVENGTVTLIGATTENPMLEVNKALLSRCQIVELKRIGREGMRKILERALTDRERGLGEEPIELTEEAEEALFLISGGDARILLNTLEIAFLSSDELDGKVRLSRQDILDSSQKKVVSYDKGEEEHYNTISAFIKSVRGSDPDAAVYYLARMLAGGEDPLFIARRLLILASEDVGNADPAALPLAASCYFAVSQLGMPEARITLSQATTYLASCPKSNASYLAVEEASQYLREHGPADIPAKLKDTHYAGADQLGRGLDYLYPHDYPGGYVLQNYLPDEIIGVSFYHPKAIGREQEIRERLNRLKADKEEKEKGGKEC